MSQFLAPGATAPSDPELISAVRGGDGHAYGVLFERHRGAALGLARQIAGSSDADDLVSDAFIKVLRVLSDGGGPDVAFRAYLLTAVRRLHIDRIRASSRVRPTDQIEAFDPGVPFVDPAVSQFENTAAAKAFASLPERWQLVLWHLEVEGQKPADVAPLLGLTANSVSALAYRAREGLRQAYLQMHMADTAAEECRWVTERLGAHVRNGLSRRDATKVDQHLDECTRCAAVYLELTEVNSNLSAIIAPLLLGSAAAAYVAGASGGSTAVGAMSVLAKAGHFASANTAAVVGTAATSAAVVGVAVAVVVSQNHQQATTTADNPITATAPGASSQSPGEPPPSSPNGANGSNRANGPNGPTTPPGAELPAPLVPFVPFLPLGSDDVPSFLEPFVESDGPLQPTPPKLTPSTSAPTTTSPATTSATSTAPTTTAPTTTAPSTTSPTTTAPPTSTAPPTTAPTSTAPPTTAPTATAPPTTAPTTTAPPTTAPTSTAPTTTAPTTVIPPLPAEPILGAVTSALADLGIIGTDVGDLITYTIPLTNAGEGALTNVTMELTGAGTAACPPGDLPGGTTVTCTAEYAISQVDVDAGSVTTTITVSGQDKISGETVSASQPTTYPLKPAPLADLTVDASAVVQDLNGVVGVNLGDQIDYSFDVKNTGALTLSNVTVKDAKLGTVACVPQTLPPGKPAECTTAYVIQPLDVAAGEVVIEAVAHAVASRGAIEATAPAIGPIKVSPIGVDASVSLAAAQTVGGLLVSFTPPTHAPATQLKLTATSTRKVLSVSFIDFGNWKCNVATSFRSIDCTIDSLSPTPISFVGRILPNTTITVDLETIGNADPNPGNNHDERTF
ncbi:MAG: sigma-70 family RNA polymerase sigma factor [Nocardioidaceae bacterium]